LLLELLDLLLIGGQSDKWIDDVEVAFCWERDANFWSCKIAISWTF
jgi:hypothetical protein